MEQHKRFCKDQAVGGGRGCHDLMALYVRSIRNMEAAFWIG